MLDDLKMIHNRDASDTLGIAAAQGGQLAYEFSLSPIDTTGITNVVYAAMGGSALAAQLAATWPGCSLPFEVVRQYHLPHHVSDKSLVIAASYSGNTEEVLSMLKQAEKRHARIIVITAGGKLLDIARAKNYPLALLPKTAQPRYALLANFKAVIDIFAAAHICATGDYERQLLAAQEFLVESSQTWLPEIPTARNPAKRLAQELMGRSVVVYSGPLLYPAAYKWKIACNENAKQVAWAGLLPEFNHNEFTGWSKQPTHKPYAIIELRSSLEHLRVQKRFDVGERLLSGLRPAPIIVEPRGDTLLTQLLWSFAYADFVSIYLALLNGVDPAPVALVDTFKTRMEQP